MPIWNSSIVQCCPIWQLGKTKNQLGKTKNQLFSTDNTLTRVLCCYQAPGLPRCCKLIANPTRQVHAYFNTGWTCKDINGKYLQIPSQPGVQLYNNLKWWWQVSELRRLIQDLRLLGTHKAHNPHCPWLH